MKECQKIESLLYLYREGELSARERSMVLEHTRNCSRCHEILQQLLSMDAVLAPLRESVPELSADAVLVDETMDRIAGTSVKVIERGQTVSLTDQILRWLRPALSFAVLAAVSLLVTQQSRDAAKLSDLENRLRTHGNAAVSADIFANSEAHRLFEMALKEQKKEASPISPLRSATVAGDPMNLIGSGILGLFQHDSGLFEEFARRYPGLSKITLENGIDENEKKILATEGKAFMKEFEQLLREGEK
jgi:hypothetical protein